MRQPDQWDKLREDIVVLILATVPGAIETAKGWQVRSDQFRFELNRYGKSYSTKGVSVTGDINLYCRNRLNRKPSFWAKNLVEAKAKLEQLVATLQKRHESAALLNKQAEEADSARQLEYEATFKAFEEAGLKPEIYSASTIQVKTPTLEVNVSWDNGYKKVWLSGESKIGTGDAQIIAFVNLLRGQK